MVGECHFALAEAAGAATQARGSDVLLGEMDCGGAQNGTLLLIVDNAASSDVANLDIWTSNRSDFCTSGTQRTAVASDGTRQIVIASDFSTIKSTDLRDAAISDLTISSNKISSITEDGLYAIAIRDCGRYLQVQYDSDGTGSKMTGAFIGHDLAQARWRRARSAY